MKYIKVLTSLLFLALIQVSIAHEIVDNTNFSLDNGAIITIQSPQTFSNTTDPALTVYNSTDTPASTLKIHLNDTPIMFQTATDKNISNISYINNTWNWTVEGTDGYLNTTAAFDLSTNFSFFVDGILNSQNVSSNKIISFNYSWAGAFHTFMINQSPAARIIFYNNSLSSSSINPGNYVTISLNVDCSSCNVNTVAVKVLRPDATYGVGDDSTGNWTMTHVSGTLWTYVYTTTSSLGTYQIKEYYVTGDAGITGYDISTLTFSASNPSSVSGGSGGSGNPAPTSTVNVSNVSAVPEVPYINLPNLANDPTGRNILQILLLIGLIMVAYGLLVKNAKIGTTITGLIVLGISAYALGYLT